MHIFTMIAAVAAKSQRITKNLGYNTARLREEHYRAIEAISPTARCSNSNHEGDRIRPVREFYQNKGGTSVQGACIVCQTNYRANRIRKSREKFEGKTRDEIRDIYVSVYGQTKTCSKCKQAKPPVEFPVSISMETGLHNHCIQCSIGNSQGNGGLRDFIFMPDKDGVKYAKHAVCERCGGDEKLAVDHILPIAKGGTDCINNKQTLCIHCNSRKSDTIDCAVNADLLCERYRTDATLNFANNITLSQSLSKLVYEFRKTHIDDAPLDDIRTSLAEYIQKHNLGHNLDRIIRKICVIFNKTG